ncbi:Lateral organ boundaries domain containing protein [Parasponia andersonii]|uniref:Lateral organ boundaries domain containing protein n=1 Tax=Parasponia andersonii TaxID=3476 RepID=A0A2P5CJ93_PARAD|nr:Lateral organ boundaries domain containing protein [Parasponia andersonii]
MTLKGGTSQACAACKYQRRRCSPECPLAPFFPPDQPKLFQNAHKLFGVSNILKILKRLEPEQKATAMWSIIYQANERDRDPVHGSLGRICQLRYQIWHTEQELSAVQARLEMCRQQQQHQHPMMPSMAPHHHDHDHQHHPQDLVMNSQLELGMAPPSNAVPILNNDHTPQPYNTHVMTGLPMIQQHQQAYSRNNASTLNSAAAFVDSKEINSNNEGNPLWAQYPYTSTTYNGNNNNSSVAMQSQPLIGSQPPEIQQEVVQDYDEMPFFDTMDDRQSYIDSKEAYGQSSSEESVLKDTTQSIDHVANNELKNAAARLSLTSVN